MKNEVLKSCLLYLFIGLIVSSCSTSQKITSCPNFKSKNKKAAFAFKAKKKQKKASSKIVRTSIKKEDKSLTAKTTNQKTVALVQSISSISITNIENEEFNISALQKSVLPISTQNANLENGLNNATVSAENFMEILPTEKLKSLGIEHIAGGAEMASLSKKQIKAIRKQAKKDLKKKLKDEGSSSNAKISAIIGYLGIIGFLIAYLALHEKGVMWLMGILGAAQGEKKPVFLLGEFFQKIFSGID